MYNKDKTMPKNYFSLRLPDELNKKIRELAEKDLRPINSQIIYLLKLGLEKYSDNPNRRLDS